MKKNYLKRLNQNEFDLVFEVKLLSDHMVQAEV